MSSTTQTPPPTAFTLKADKRVPFLELEVLLTYPEQREPATRTKALLSISEPQSQVSQLIVDALGLDPVSVREGEPQQYCKVDLFLPNRIRCASMPVLLNSKLPKGRDCIIGMDLLSMGDLSLSGAEGGTLFSFRLPAQGGQDYVKIIDATAASKPLVAAAPKKGARYAVPTTPEQPCPCGSGKKHKNCCGRLIPRNRKK